MKDFDSFGRASFNGISLTYGSSRQLLKSQQTYLWISSSMTEAGVLAL